MVSERPPVASSHSVSQTSVASCADSQTRALSLTLASTLSGHTHAEEHTHHAAYSHSLKRKVLLSLSLSLSLPPGTHTQTPRSLSITLLAHTHTDTPLSFCCASYPTFIAPWHCVRERACTLCSHGSFWKYRVHRWNSSLGCLLRQPLFQGWWRDDWNCVQYCRLRIQMPWR